MKGMEIGKGSIFELEGIPAFRQVLPLALQHVVAMIVAVSHQPSLFQEPSAAEACLRETR